jgi:hypothetical protein
MQNTGRNILAWLVICIVGPIAGLIFLLFKCRGLIKIEGYWATFWDILEGNLVIISNHPTMRDPLVYVGMWWWACIIFPRKFLVWNLPGKNYFDDVLSSLTRGIWTNFPEWIYPIIHCIQVDRSGGNNKDVIRKANQVVTNGHTLINLVRRGEQAARTVIIRRRKLSSTTTKMEAARFNRLPPL